MTETNSIESAAIALAAETLNRAGIKTSLHNEAGTLVGASITHSGRHWRLSEYRVGLVERLGDRIASVQQFCSQNEWEEQYRAWCDVVLGHPLGHPLSSAAA